MELFDVICVEPNERSICHIAFYIALAEWRGEAMLRKFMRKNKANWEITTRIFNNEKKSFFSSHWTCAVN